MLFNLIDARRAAEKYLRDSISLLPDDIQATLIKITDNYGMIYQELSAFYHKIKFDCGGEGTANNPLNALGAETKELRQEQIAVLNKVLKLESENAETAKNILALLDQNSDASNCRIEQHSDFELCGFSIVIKECFIACRRTFFRHIVAYHKGMGFVILKIIQSKIETFRLVRSVRSVFGKRFNTNVAVHFFELAGFMTLPEKFRRRHALLVPALTWAIFSSSQDVGADPSVHCSRAWNLATEWLSASEYEYMGSPKIEKGYNFGNMDFRYEVWIPVQKKTIKKKKQNRFDDLLLATIPDLIYKCYAHPTGFF
jgi:hypothetical protein